MNFISAKLVFVPWLWNKMAFIKRKTVKFSVDLQVCQLSDVPLVNATVFGKMRLLDGGSFEEATERVEEQKGGKSYYKLGFVDINLSEYAASGVEGISRTYLLNGYTSNQRLDNSKVCIKVAMTHQSADPFFRVPRLSTFGPRQDGAIDQDGFRADDETDSEEGTSSHPKLSNVDVLESSSAASNSQVDEPVVERRVIHPPQHPTCQLRRFSQDRSAQKIQHSRFDADNVIDKIIAECRISEDEVESNSGGLVLEKFLDKHGKPLVNPRQPVKRTSYVAEHFNDA
nr:hypothetical protein C54H2.1 - Caenorhabditis elegans [Caenorhabditis elegans]